MNLNGKKILVTGGCGFIGSHLCHRLIELGNEVVCLDNVTSGKKSNIADLPLTLIEGDIRDLEECKKAVEGVQCIFHLAAIGSVPQSIDNPLETLSVNVLGFTNILLAAKEANVDRIVYASSSAVYGDSKNLPKIEGEEGTCLSPYASSKRSCELFAESFAKAYGMTIVGIRYFNVFGEKQSPDGPYAAVIPKFIEALIKKERPIIFGDGEQLRDFTYIDNVTHINLLAAQKESLPDGHLIVNGACGKKTSLNELFSIIQDKLPPAKKITPRYQDPRPGDIKESWASIKKSEALLGYKPMVSFEEGIHRTVDWYKQALLRLI